MHDLLCECRRTARSSSARVRAMEADERHIPPLSRSGGWIPKFSCRVERLVHVFNILKTIKLKPF